MTVGQEIIGEVAADQSCTGKRERDPTGIDRYPASSPLFGDIRSGAGTTGRIQHEISGVGGHQNAALNDERSGFDYVNLISSETGGVGPNIAETLDRIVVYIKSISQFLSLGANPICLYDTVQTFWIVYLPMPI